MENHGYTHLSMEEREEITRGLVQGLSLRAMARRLNRSSGTLSRELARNARDPGAYRAVEAHERAKAKAHCPRRQRKLLRPVLWKAIQEHLRARWSPEQIAARLKGTILRIRPCMLRMRRFMPRCTLCLAVPCDRSC